MYDLSLSLSLYIYIYIYRKQVQCRCPWKSTPPERRTCGKGAKRHERLQPQCAPPRVQLCGGNRAMERGGLQTKLARGPEIAAGRTKSGSIAKGVPRTPSTCLC